MEIENLIDHKTRLKEGIFFTKPEIVQEIVETFDFSTINSVIDSAAGSCNFLIPLAEKYPGKKFYGIEKNIDIYRETQKIISHIPNLKYFHGDAIVDSFPIPKCDLYIGNPPFINFSDLDLEYRERIKATWLKHFPESKGFKMLLGDSRGDLSQLIFYHTIDKYLLTEGRVGVILPNSLIKGNSASAGFRKFNNFKVTGIKDIGDRDPFDNTNRNCFYILGLKGEETLYPIKYFTNNGVLELVKKGDNLVESGDSITGESTYRARQGINTLGANSVFFFKKHPPLESPLILPLLKSSDIKAFSCEPSYSVLMPYDKKGNLLSESQLLNEHRDVYDYLNNQKERLISRKSRFAQKSWYTLFGVGKYTFSSYMVVWKGLGAREMEACVTSGVIPNQSMNCYISSDSADEAYFICGIMNSSIYKRELAKLNESGAKSFAQPTTINQIFIPKYDPGDKLHCELSQISNELHSIFNLNSMELLNSIVNQIYNFSK